MKWIVLYAIPGFIALIVLEATLIRRMWASDSDGRNRRILGYESRDTAASLAMGIGDVLLMILFGSSLAALMYFLYQHRLWTVGSGIAGWGLTFLVEDFTYYWWHRCSHESRFLWAAHENHHSSQHYNLSTALRQSWTTIFTTKLFYWPLPLLGFDPAMLAVATSVSLLYQFWIHTECIERLGWFEWLLNTPSHHRVHHGSNIQYLDRNHAGILILWDRLFGTFEPEVEPVRYGLTKNIQTFHPIRIAFHEWVALGRDMYQAKSLLDALRYFFAPPGWSPDGRTQTSRELRRLSLRSPLLS